MSRIGTTDWLIEVQKGNVEGHSIATIQGVNDDVDLAAEEDLWAPGGTLVYPTIGETWEILSDDAADTSAGTGARTVRVTYLDDAWIEQTEDKTLNGVSAVTFTATDAFRHVSTKVLTSGSTGENEGNLTIQVSSGGAVRSGMFIGENNSLDGHFTVPDGKTAYFIFGYGAVGKNKDSRIRFKSTNGSDGQFVTLFGLDIYQSTIGINFDAPGEGIPERSDIKLTAVTDNNDTSVSGIGRFLLVEDGF